MNVEIAAYAVILAVAVAFSLPPVERVVERHIVSISLLAFSALSLAVRFSPPRSDFLNYFRALREGSRIQAYEWREPVVWFGARAVSAVTHNPSITYFILDMLVFAIVVAAFRKLKLPAYAFIAVMAFFPFLLGMQNIYRQWAASCLLLYAVANVDRGPVRPIAAFLLAVATHQVSVIFAGLLVPALPKRLRLPALVLCVVVAPIVMFVGGSTRETTSTGADLQFLYGAVIAVIAAACTFAQWKRAGRLPDAEDCLPHLYLLYVMVVSTMVMASALSERIGLACLILLYPSIASLPNVLRGWWATAGRMVIAIGGFVPVLIFGTRIFLF